MLELKGFDGHIVLYCKNHYKYPKGFIAGLRMIWAIRCGYDYNEKDIFANRNIADKLYSILRDLIPNGMTHLQERIHEDIVTPWRYEGLSPLEKLISIYCSEIMNIQVKDKVGEKYIAFIKLPKPNKRVFNRILRGNGKYQDYYLIEPKT